MREKCCHKTVIKQCEDCPYQDEEDLVVERGYCPTLESEKKESRERLDNFIRSWYTIRVG